jgi:hypothetical protein
VKLARFGIAICALGAACAEAGGDVKGGDITEAGVQATTPGDFDAGAKLVPAECVGEGTTWTALYRDIFATGKPGSCTYESNCHGTPEGEGAQAGAGIKCFDQAGCRQSMIDQNMATPGNQAAPDGANLFTTMRNINPKSGKLRGRMPKDPAGYIFSDTCMQRIRTWIANGVPAD